MIGWNGSLGSYLIGGPLIFRRHEYLQRPPSRLVAVRPVAVRSLGKLVYLSLAALRSNLTLATLCLSVNQLTSCRFATSQRVWPVRVGRPPCWRGQIVHSLLR